jgi:hypothetical protein
LDLNGTHHILVYAKDINILGKSINTIKKNAEALSEANSEVDVKVNAEKTKYMLISLQ